MLATDPQQLSGSFLGLAYMLLNGSFQSLLETAGGHVDKSVVRGPIASDGVIDSLRFLLSMDSSTLSRHMIRLMCA